MRFQLSEERTKCGGLERRNSDGSVTSAEYLDVRWRYLVTLIKHEQSRDSIQLQLIKDGDDGRNLNINVYCAAIDNMQQKISLSEFFERCPKGADQFWRKIPNKPYRVGNDDFAILGKPQATARRVQGFE